MTKSSTSQVAAKKARGIRRKSATKGAGKKARDTGRKTASKIAVEKAHDSHRKISASVFGSLEPRDMQQKIAERFEAFEAFRDAAQVPDSLRALAERNVAQTREQYERSKSMLNAVLESWQKSFGAAGQGAVALNGRIIDIADRNINNAFDLAAGLAGAKNLTEAMEVQAAFWRKQLAYLGGQAKRVRAPSTADVTRQSKSK
jgi:hypothetical protein